MVFQRALRASLAKCPGALSPRSGTLRCQERCYFACRVSMYETRLLILCCTCASCPWLILENKGPHTGISWLPWDGVDAVPLITDATCAAGYLPPFFCASRLRSEGEVFIAEAAGPLPFAS